MICQICILGSRDLKVFPKVWPNGGVPATFCFDLADYDLTLQLAMHHYMHVHIYTPTYSTYAYGSFLKWGCPQIIQIRPRLGIETYCWRRSPVFLSPIISTLNAIPGRSCFRPRSPPEVLGSLCRRSQSLPLPTSGGGVDFPMSGWGWWMGHTLNTGVFPREYDDSLDGMGYPIFRQTYILLSEPKLVNYPKLWYVTLIELIFFGQNVWLVLLKVPNMLWPHVAGLFWFRFLHPEDTYRRREDYYVTMQANVLAEAVCGFHSGAGNVLLHCRAVYDALSAYRPVDATGRRPQVGSSCWQNGIVHPEFHHKMVINKIPNGWFMALFYLHEYFWGPPHLTISRWKLSYNWKTPHLTISRWKLSYNWKTTS